MTTTLVSPEVSQKHLSDDVIKQTITTMIDDLIAALPDPHQLTPEERRGIIARYSTVLEGNFIYWMTGAWLASDNSNPISTMRTMAGRSGRGSSSQIEDFIA